MQLYKDRILLPYPESTINKVKTMFQMRNEGSTLQEIGNTFNVTREAVRLILKGESYKDIIERYNLKVENMKQIRFGYFTKQQLLYISKRINEGVEIDLISQELKISEATLRKHILKNKEVEKFLRNNEVDVKKLRQCFDNRDFSKNDIINIFKLYGEGKSQSEIGKLYGVRQTHISNILRGEYYIKEIKELGLTPVYTNLKEENIIYIFSLYNSGLSQSEIAKKLNVTVGAINLNLNGKSNFSKKIIEKYKLTKRELSNNNLVRKLSEEQVLEIFKLRNEENLSYLKLAKRFNLGRSSIIRILNGETYADISKKHNLLDNK
ncbi:hypothetical protein [Niallia sp. FSL M8-0099]|uniref:hypothetical protein n=1 Tax=Niallia sp. FSL M8-0099 TaxID=2954519 RepID=UPI0030F65B98